MKTHKQKLQAARKLIVKGWCRGTAAKDAKGQPVPFDSPKARRFCMLGACHRFRADFGLLWAHVPGWMSLAGFNDSKKNKRDILRVFDKAIAACP